MKVAERDDKEDETEEDEHCNNHPPNVTKRRRHCLSNCGLEHDYAKSISETTSATVSQTSVTSTCNSDCSDSNDSVDMDVTIQALPPIKNWPKSPSQSRRSPNFNWPNWWRSRCYHHQNRTSYISWTDWRRLKLETTLCEFFCTYSKPHYCEDPLYYIWDTKKTNLLIRITECFGPNLAILFGRRRAFSFTIAVSQSVKVASPISIHPRVFPLKATINGL